VHAFEIDWFEVAASINNELGMEKWAPLGSPFGAKKKTISGRRRC
jgi:hypothetical protein